MRILLMRFDPFDHAVLDVVHGLGVRGRPLLRPALGAAGDERELVGETVDIEIEKDRGSRPIMMGRLVQQRSNARNGRLAGSGSAHADFNVSYRASRANRGNRLAGAL